MRLFSVIFILIILFISNVHAENISKKCDLEIVDIQVLGNIVASGNYQSNIGNSTSDNKTSSKKLINKSYSGTICLPNVIYISIKNNKVHGRVVFYNDKGVLQQIISYKNGKPNGDFITYYENGNIESKGTLKNGLNNGKYFEYFENGKTKVVRVYKLGSKNGNEKIYDDLGNILNSINYKNGNLNGKSTIYLDNKPWSYLYYNNNELTKAVCAGSGKVWSKSEYDNYILYMEAPKC